MNTFEQLEDVAYRDGIEIHKHKFNSDNIKGLYFEGNIALNENALQTTAERTCTLSEELGHHYTSYGDIIDQSDSQAKKQEYQARLWGYDCVIGLDGLIKAFEHGCKNQYEIAEYLEVTDEFLRNCIKSYTDKYGVYAIHKNYIIYFIPCLMIGKKY